MNVRCSRIRENFCDGHRNIASYRYVEFRVALLWQATKLGSFTEQRDAPEAIMTSAITDTFSTLNGSFVRMLDWNRAMFEKTWRATHEESLRFINRRLEHNARALQSMRDIQGVSALFAAEQDWLVDAAKDYVETGEKIRGRFFELATSTVQEAAEQGRSTAETFRASANEVADKAKRAAEHAQKQAAE
jgi:hypothetical protein